MRSLGRKRPSWSGVLGHRHAIGERLDVRPGEPAVTAEGHDVPELAFARPPTDRLRRNVEEGGRLRRTEIGTPTAAARGGAGGGIAGRLRRCHRTEIGTPGANLSPVADAPRRRHYGGSRWTWTTAP